MIDWEKWWELCELCGAMIVCPECGMNCCSGGYGQVGGEDCPRCPQAYDAQSAAIDERRVPVIQGPRRLIWNDVRMATDEDLKAI